MPSAMSQSEVLLRFWLLFRLFWAPNLQDFSFIKNMAFNITAYHKGYSIARDRFFNKRWKASLDDHYSCSCFWSLRTWFPFWLITEIFLCMFSTLQVHNRHPMIFSSIADHWRCVIGVETSDSTTSKYWSVSLGRSWFNILYWLQ